jgi:hypothetical protein
MKNKRVRMSEDFLVVVRRSSMAILVNIVTMDKSAILFHTPEIKEQYKR